MIVKRKVSSNELIVYGDDSFESDLIKSILDSNSIPYEYVDIKKDEFYKHRLLNITGNFTTPKIEYGLEIYDYSGEIMAKVLKDFS